MALHTLFRTAVAAGLLVAGGVAQAGTVTFNDWFYGNGNTATVTPAFNNNSSFNAGAFKVTLSNFAGASAAFNGKSFEAYCVELTEYFNSGGVYNNFQIVTAAAYFSAPVASKLTQLVSYVNNNSSVFSAAGVDKDMQSSALQLAIWNTVYDSDATLDAGSLAEGTTQLRTTTANHSGSNYLGSNDLLGNAGSSSGYSLYVLKSVATPNAKGQQDQLIWLRNDVPEPASLALVVLALGGAAFASRRRG